MNIGGCFGGLDKCVMTLDAERARKTAATNTSIDFDDSGYITAVIITIINNV